MAAIDGPAMRKAARPKLKNFNARGILVA